MDCLQRYFFEALKIAQEDAVYRNIKDTAEKTIESILFSTTYDMACFMMEILDGYRDERVQVDVVERNTQYSLNPDKNLHDKCETYLRSL